MHVISDKSIQLGTHWIQQMEIAVRL